MPGMAGAFLYEMLMQFYQARVHIQRETARKSQRTKRQTSLKTPMRSLLFLCRCEHRLELVHREAERGLASLWRADDAVHDGVAIAAHLCVEALLDLAHGGALGLWVRIRVYVQGHRHACVSQIARDSPHVAASRDHHGGEGVPEVMEGALEAVHLAEGGEVLPELRGVVGPALLLLRAQYVGVSQRLARLDGLQKSPVVFDNVEVDTLI